MRRFVSFTWLVLLLAACTPVATPVPTPDAKATETRIAFSIFATQTANAPSPTAIPTNTVALIPTTIRVPSTSTPRPSPTPPPPPTIPAGWKTYTTMADNFTLAYPSDWTVREELASGVSFQQGYERLIGVAEGEFQLTSNAESDINRYVEYSVGKLSRSYTMKLLDKGLWNDGRHDGVYAEFTMTQAPIPNYAFFVALRLAGKTVMITWMRQMEATDKPRETLRILSASLRAGR